MRIGYFSTLIEYVPNAPAFKFYLHANFNQRDKISQYAVRIAFLFFYLGQSYFIKNPVKKTLVGVFAR
jgi:hypothetical protein